MEPHHVRVPRVSQVTGPGGCPSTASRGVRWAMGMLLSVAVGCSGGGGGDVEAPLVDPTGTDKPTILMETELGDIRIELFETPETISALNIVTDQVLTGKYDSSTFFDVRPGTYVQFGASDPALARIPTAPVEVTGEPLDRGVVALGWLGNRDETSHRLIFPLTRLDPLLDSKFTVFGQVVDGLDVLDEMPAGQPLLRVNVDLQRPLMRIRMADNKGSILMELRPDQAPITVGQITSLVCQGFYNGLTFHRVEGALIQGGDPLGDGTGGSGITIPAEFNPRRFQRSAVGMARELDDPDSADSQFFIMKEKVREFDGSFTFFARVIAGMNVVDQVQVGDVMEDVTLQFDLNGRDCVDAVPGVAGTGAGVGDDGTSGLPSAPPPVLTSPTAG